MTKLKELFKRTAAAAAPHALRALAAACLVSAAVALTAPAAHAEGTRDLYETGYMNYKEVKNKDATETVFEADASRINFYCGYTNADHTKYTRDSGGVVGGQKVKFYAYEGEVVFIGTSALWDNNPSHNYRITITDPNAATEKIAFNDNVGYIQNRDQEKAGPYIAGTPINLPKLDDGRKATSDMNPTPDTGYKPIVYEVKQSGVYTIELESWASGTYPNKDTNNSITSQDTLNEYDFDKYNSLYDIMAWDVTVAQPKDSGGNDVKCTEANYTDRVVRYDAFSGRVWATAMTMQWHGKGGYGYLYTVTNDGYIWRLGFNGMSPYTCSLYANRRGVVGVSTNASVYHSFHEPMSNTTGFNAYKTLKDKNGNADGVRIIGPDTIDNDLDSPYKMFFNYPSPTMPFDEVNVKTDGTPNGNDGNMGTIQGLRFDGRNNGDSDIGGDHTSYGSAKDPNDYGTVGVGGYFEVNTGKATSYRIIIDMSNMYAANYHGEKISEGKYYDYKDGETPGHETDNSHIHEEEICLSTEDDINFIFFNNVKDTNGEYVNKSLDPEKWYSIQSVDNDRHPQTNDGEIKEKLVQVEGDGTLTEKKQFTYDTSKVIKFEDITGKVTGTSGNEEVTIDGKTFKSLGVIMLGNSAVEDTDDRINWDGRDQYGRILPVGKYFGDTGLGEVYAQPKMGEVHFPISDAEAIVNGLSLWLENPPKYVTDLNDDKEISVRSSLYYNNVDKSLMRDFKTNGMTGLSGKSTSTYDGNNTWYWNLPSNLQCSNITNTYSGQNKDNKDKLNWTWNPKTKIYSSWTEAKNNGVKLDKATPNGDYAVYENMSIDGVASYSGGLNALAPTKIASKFLNSCGSDHGVIDVWAHVVGENEKFMLDEPIILSHTSDNIIAQGFVYLEVTSYSTVDGKTIYDKNTLGTYDTQNTSDHALFGAKVHAYYGKNADEYHNKGATGEEPKEYFVKYDTETNTDGLYSIPIDTTAFGDLSQDKWKVYVEIVYSSPESPNAVTHYVTTPGKSEDVGGLQKMDEKQANKVYLTIPLNSTETDANGNPIKRKTFYATNVGYYADKKEFPVRIQKHWEGARDNSLSASYTILGFEYSVDKSDWEKYYVDTAGTVRKKVGAEAKPNSDPSVSDYIFIRQHVSVDEQQGGKSDLLDLPMYVYGSGGSPKSVSSATHTIVCFVAVEEPIGGNIATPTKILHNTQDPDIKEPDGVKRDAVDNWTMLDGTKYDLWEFTNEVKKGTFKETVYVDKAEKTVSVTVDSKTLSYKHGDHSYDDGYVADAGTEEKKYHAELDEGCAEAIFTLQKFVNGTPTDFEYTLSDDQKTAIEAYIATLNIKINDLDTQIKGIDGTSEENKKLKELLEAQKAELEAEKETYNISEHVVSGSGAYFTIVLKNIKLSNTPFCTANGVIELANLDASQYQAKITYPVGEHYTGAFELTGEDDEAAATKKIVGTEDVDTHTVTQTFTIPSGGSINAEVGIGSFNASAKLGGDDGLFKVSKEVTCTALSDEEFPFGSTVFNYALEFQSFSEVDGKITPYKGDHENESDAPVPFTLTPDAGATLEKFGETAEMLNYTNITFHAVGTYTFKLKEIPGSIQGMVYDKVEYTVVFDVSNKKDDATGKWEPEIICKIDGAQISPDNRKINFENVYNTGTVTVTKKVEGTGAPDDDEFTFKVGLKDSSDKPLSGDFNISSPDSALSKITNDGTFTLKKDESATITLPDGAKVTITEEKKTAITPNLVGAAEPAYKTEVAVGASTKIEANAADVEIKQGSKESVTFTNTFKSGTLKITESFVGIDGVEKVPYDKAKATVTLTLPAAFDVTEYDYAKLLETSDVAWTVTDGKIVGTVTFSESSQTVTIDGIPAGTTFEITPTIPEKYVLTKKDNSSGTITDGNTVDANLVYTPDPKVTIDIKKQITGEPTTKKFEFVFTAATTTTETISDLTVSVPAGETAGSGKFTKTYNLVDFSDKSSVTYNYTVTEDTSTLPKADGGQTIFTPDGASYGVTVTIEKQSDGTLEVTKTAEAKKDGTGADFPLVFTNQYTPVEAKATIDVTKNLKVPDGVSATPTDTDFDFIFNPDDESTAEIIPTINNLKIQVTANTDKTDYTGTGSASVTFDKAGTYVYTVTEQKGSATGMSYSEEKYKVEFVVTDNAGTLEVSDPTISKADASGQYHKATEGITFTNTYDPLDATTNEYGFIDNEHKFTKTLTADGQEIEFNNDVFKFTADLTYEDGSPSGDDAFFESGQNKNKKTDISTVGTDHVIEVGTIKFTKAGKYKLTVSEVDDGKDNITYDPDSRTVTYDVKDNKSGQLEVTATCTNTVFKNTCKPAELTMQIDKTLTVADGVTNPPTGFTFNFESGDNVPAIDPVTITVVKSEDGYKGTGSTNVEFTHPGNYTYTVSEGDIGTGMRCLTEDYTVTVEVSSSPSAPGLVTNVTISGGDTGAKLSDDGKTVILPFANYYSPNSVSTTDITDADLYTAANVVITKTLKTAAGTDVDFKDGDFSFTATITADDGSKLTNDEAYFENHLDAEPLENVGGKVTVGNITFTKAGIYTLTVREVDDKKANITYDTAPRTVTYNVIDDSGRLKIQSVAAAVDGKETDDISAACTVNNKYEVSPITLSVEKTLTVVDGEPTQTGFTFDVSGTATSGTNPELNMTAPEFTVAPVTVSADDYKGTTDPVPAVFDKPGTYVYTVKENKGSAAGMTYSDKSYTVTIKVENASDAPGLTTTITVKDEGKNLVSDAVNGNAITLPFENKYQPLPTSTEDISPSDDLYTAANVVITKTLKTYAGTDITFGKGAFAFDVSISPADGAALSKTEFKNDADGRLRIGNITFTKEGIYTLTVKEKIGDYPNVTYDKSTHTIVYTVEDIDGQLTITNVTGNPGSLAFNNEYEVSPITLSVEKTLTVVDGNPTQMDFTFDVSGTATSGTDPKLNITAPEFTVDPVTVSADDYKGTTDPVPAVFDKPGTYEYTVKENKGSAAGMTYSDKSYTITIEVENTTESPGLTTTITVKDEDDNPVPGTVNGNAITLPFVNTYKPLPTSTEQIPHDEEDEEDDDDEFYNRANVVITKTLKTAAGTDVDFKDGDFSFTATLTAADGTSLTNDEAYFDNHLDTESLENVGGKVTVGNITFTKAGKYKLTVSENKGENADITYDSRKISVIYTVAENSGRLEILSAETGDEYLFANIFTPHPVAVTPSLHKSLINTFSGNDRLGVDNTRGFYDGRFSFTLTAADGNPDGAEIKTPTAENITVEAGDGKAKYENVAFTDGIEFTREGSYTFTVAENIPADAVIDSATGRLISADGKFAFVEGQTVTVTYTVTADRTGQLVATAAYSPASPVITNYYNYNPCLLTVTNEITAADGVKIHENQAFEYVVELWDRDGNPYSGELVYSKASAAPAAIALPMAGDGSDIQTMQFIDGVNAEPIMLASGAGIEFEGIPDGFSFAVTQKPYPAEVGDAYELTGIELGGTADAESIVSERKAAGSFNAEDDTATVRFINNYSLTPVKASPKAGKQVVWNNDGTPIDMTENYGGAFEFGLELLSAEHEDGAKILSDTAENDEKGNIAFTDAIEFTNEGVYIFSVYEKTPESPDPHITYTSQRFTVTYTVTADIAGRLSAAAVYDSDPVFENEFSPVPCTLTVINTVDGDYIHAEKEFEYELTLTNADGTPFEGSLPYRTGKPAPQLAAPMASGETMLQFIGGKASFTLRHLESITIYSIDDGISYSVTQKDYSAEGYTGSAAAAINGVADGLTVKGSFTAENVEAEADYLNVYRVKPVTPEAVTVIKKLSGKPVGDRSFEFKVSGENVDETLKITVPEGEEEANAFWQPGEYTEVGVYEYIVEEIAGTDPGMDYDTAVYTVDVTVTDNGAGQLEAAVAVAKDGAEAEGIAFENFYNSGVLTVEKKVTGSAGDTEKEFDFTVKIDGLSGVYGDMTFDDGMARFKLKHGESMTASGLPDGVSYEVSEETDPAEGYLVTAQGETGTIKKGQRSTAIFVNHRDSASSVTAGDLVISLTVVNPRAGEENASYPFRVTLSEPISGIFDGAEFADGVSIVYLKNGDSLHIGELAAGITYTVEQAFEDETAEVSFNGETGTILAGETSRTGIYIRFTDSTEFKKPGNLTVTKTVAGAPTDAAFGFDIVLDDAGVNGVYGDMEFIGGRAHIELRHGESATAKELPSGTVYRVTETDSFGYTATSVNASGSIPERDTAVAAFVNVENRPEFAVGDLKIVKNIAGNAANPADVFGFEIILDKDISGVYGDVEFTSGRALVSLSAGQSATARGLPAGTGYTVSEIDGGLGYISSSDGSFGFITKNAVMTASFVNTLNAPITEPLTGGLTVSKTVAGTETEARFGIDVTLTEPLEGVYGDMTFSAGVARLSLANGESATATGLPAGIGYSVYENPEDAIGFTVSGSGLEGIIPDGGYAAASVVNTAPTIPNGDLVIAKTVTGTGADRTLEFPFTVTLTDTSINGLYGELEFTNGVATVNLSHGMSAVASGLPAGIGYTVSEDSLGYTATYTGEQGTIIANGICAAAFVNRYDIYIPPVGNLYVTKQVAGTDCDSSLKFPFRVTLSDSTINGVYGDMEFVGGVAEFELSENDGEIAATGLPEGTEYLVEETDTLGYEQEAVFGERGVIREYIDSSASFINSLSIPPYGDLRVYKTVSGSGADIYDEFAFRVTLSDKSVNGTFGEMEFVNGVAEFTLSHGESRYASGLPEGVEYLVEETDPKDYRPQAVYNEGVIVKASEAKVYFINNREIPYYPPVQQTGSLSISKTVEIGEYDREFEFTVTLTDASGFPLGGSYSFGGSKSGYISSGGTVALRHGESITIYGLPAGAKYSVSENIPENYRVESSGEAGIIPANGTAAAEFKNYREVERPTAPNSREAEAESSGRPAPGLPCGLVLTALAAGAAMGIAKRKF